MEPKVDQEAGKVNTDNAAARSIGTAAKDAIKLIVREATSDDLAPIVAPLLPLEGEKRENKGVVAKLQDVRGQLNTLSPKDKQPSMPSFIKPASPVSPSRQGEVSARPSRVASSGKR